MRRSPSLARCRARHWLALLLLVAAVPGGAPAFTAEGWQGAAVAGSGLELERVSSGVYLARLSDPALLEPEGPIDVWALRVDPGQAHLEIALAEDRTPALETVAEMAARQGAVAAVNGGFFSPRGAPQGVLRVGGHWVGVSTERARGAIAIVEDHGRTRLLFDRIRVGLSVELTRRGGQRESMRVDSVNPPGAPRGLSLYTKPYVAPEAAGPSTDSPEAGSEQQAPAARAAAARTYTVICNGRPCRLVRERSGSEPGDVPPSGFTLVYRGAQVPASLARLRRGDYVSLREQIETLHATSPRDWAAAPNILGGAGLLLTGGQPIDDWGPERVREDFVTTRHPRTLVGTDRDGFIWLVAVDGRRADSLGMRLDELQRLAARLRLVEALNLDGGGSTTLVIGEKVVNRPTDLIGPRRVSDSLLVLVP
jgi:hypothetical protein